MSQNVRQKSAEEAMPGSAAATSTGDSLADPLLSADSGGSQAKPAAAPATAAEPSGVGPAVLNAIGSARSDSV